MAFVVVYDANVLFGNTMRDLFIRIAMKRTSRIRVKWTNQILDEVFRNINVRRPDIGDKLPRVRELMNRAVPDALVTDY
ncbi:hypothetical protein [Actinomadura macra]|uniref:hypothetical protein n=1 Tax=Actinomadura macra TaxID=46164 RepID=UPI000A7CBDDB|nr:hypothetical protein [Actinomadura macra]